MLSSCWLRRTFQKTSCAFKIHTWKYSPDLLFFPVVSFSTIFVPLLPRHVSRCCFLPPHVTVSILASSPSGHSVSFCAILAPFSPGVSPFSAQQSNPFTLLSNSLGHPRVLALFFHLSVSSRPLCSAHLQHIKIPLFFLQRIVQSLGDLLHSSMFSLLFSPYLSPCLFVLAALHCL